MRSFILSIVLLGMINFFSILHSYALDKITNSLISQNNMIIEKIYDDSYDTALSQLNRLDEYVDSHHIILAATLDHSILNKIDEYIAEAGGYISECQRSDSLTACFRLSTFLENMPKNYRLKIDNIL